MSRAGYASISDRVQIITWNDYLNRPSNNIIIRLILECTVDWRQYFRTTITQLNFLKKLLKRKIHESTFLPYVQNEEYIKGIELKIQKLQMQLARQEAELANTGLKVKTETVAPVFAQFITLQRELVQIKKQLEEDKKRHLRLLTNLTK
jgi:hypothetical protein